MELQPYQQRVVDEMNELEAKIDRLRMFADSPSFESLDATNKGLLIAQSEIMSAYASVLGLRILHFK